MRRLLILAILIWLLPTITAHAATVRSCCVCTPVAGGAPFCGESNPREAGDEERRRLADEKCTAINREFAGRYNCRFVTAISACSESPVCGAAGARIGPLGEPTPTPSTPQEPSAPEPTLQFTPTPPKLQIQIPNAPEFSKVELQGEGGEKFLLIPWLAQYLAAIYRYGLSIVGIVVTVMIVFGGLKWLLAAGDQGKITSAKETIRNAVIGLILALSSTAILYIINPEIVRFKSLKISFIKKSEIPYGEFEGADTPAIVATGGRAHPTSGPCAHYAQEAQTKTCLAGGVKMPSPTGFLYGCGYHTAPGDSHVESQFGTLPIDSINQLDFGGAFGSVIRAPVAGKVVINRLKNGTILGRPKRAEDCVKNNFGSCGGGNTIDIEFGNGYSIHIAHVLLEPTVAHGMQVEAGQPIAKVGGQCCSEYNTPEWKEKTTWTKREDGTIHFWSDACKFPTPQCAPPWETGNSLGPHTHVDILVNGRRVPILPCFQ